MIIYQALYFLKNQLNSYLKFQLGDDYSDTAFISNPVTQDGSAATNTSDRILLTLTNVEEERIGKMQTPPIKSVNGQEVRVNPANLDSGKRYAKAGKRKSWNSERDERKTGLDYNEQRRALASGGLAGNP